MKKGVKKLIVLLVVLVACFAYAHVNKMHSVFDSDVDPSMYITTSIDSQEEYSHSFVVEEKALDGVAVKVNVAGEELDKVKLVYSISSSDNVELGKGEIAGSKLRNQKYNKLAFERLEDTEGKQFIFKCHLENNDEVNGVSFQFEGENMVMKYYMFRFDIETFCIALFFCMYVYFFMKVLFKMFRE